MKKSRILLVNIIIMAVMVVFIVAYSTLEQREAHRRQVLHFENTTETMERVTENYLLGEQQICDVWAQYIMKRNLSLAEAASFIRDSQVITNTFAHLVDLETLDGLSSRPSVQDASDYTVSYAGMDLLEDVSWISPLGESVNVSRAFTNPMSGEQSLAFCNRLTVRDDESGGKREALLLRVVPVEDLTQKWVFPREMFENAELSLVDMEGDYIIQGNSFLESNFFDFYRSCNRVDAEGLQNLRTRLSASGGSLTMLDSQGRECVLAYTPVSSARGWILLSLVTRENLRVNLENWLLIGVIVGGLLLLFLYDFFFMQRMNQRLHAMAQDAEAANRAKTEFLSTMSHDIRTPMNAIIGLTTIAEKNLDDPEAVGENLRKISMASNHLLTLINDILDISKVESGKLNLSPLTFSLVETVENLVNLSQPMVREKNIDFNFRVNRIEKEYLYADQLRLNQIYINILSNAIKYTPPGGRVSVDMREEPGPDAEHVRLTYIVSDTGVGMSPEFMERMYQPFSRQTDSRISSIQGTGLGLAITRKMVDLMGGTIDCRSEMGKGTTFTISLDLPVADRQRDDLRLNPMDVLIVDDDEILLETSMETLKSLGVTPESAASGEEALGMIRRRHEERRDYEVVILDWKMPGMDGIETIRKIRAEIGHGIPILLVSAYDWSDIEDAARESGANGFISKPLFRSTLYDKISDLLGVERRSAEPEDDYSDLAGLKILVAEDNDINWEIISTMLGMFGIETERAENGRICVEMMSRAPENSYTLIFMDVQMPEMNGLEATRAIRKMAAPWPGGIPIVAMTADAFSENVAECLNAGMNGHIAKPVDIKLVIREIRRIRENRS